MQFQDQQILTAFLRTSESLQWTGRPASGLLFRKSDTFLIPFSLVWGGFAGFWEFSVYNSDAPFFFLLIGGAFVLAGVYITVGRFFFDIIKRSKTVYGLTNERALILTGIFGQSLKSVELNSVSEVSLQIKSNGRGTIIFGSISGGQSMFYNLSWPGYSQTSFPLFEFIENASHVYQLVQKAQGK
jgi:hypothetical protein